MQRPSVDGRFVIIMCISSRSAQVHRPYDSGGQVNFFFINQCRCRPFLIRAEIFPLVGNAHRAFRGEKHGRMTFGRSTDNHKIDEWKLHGVGEKRGRMPCGQATGKHNFVGKLSR